MSKYLSVVWHSDNRLTKKFPRFGILNICQDILCPEYWSGYFGVLNIGLDMLVS